MQAMIYKPVAGSRLTLEQARRYGNEIQRLEIVRPLDLVEAARPADSPLHDGFEWDDTTAAEAYRRRQAAYILRSIEVEIEDKTVRAFLPITLKVADGGTSDGERAYISTVIVKNDADYLSEVIEDALKELRGWQRKYAQYTAMSERLAAINDAVSKALAE